MQKFNISMKRDVLNELGLLFFNWQLIRDKKKFDSIYSSYYNIDLINFENKS